MTITPKQIEDTFKGNSYRDTDSQGITVEWSEKPSTKDAICKLKDQGVFDQKLSTPCLQVIADNFGLVNHEDRMLIWQAIHSGEEANHNVIRIHSLQSNNSVCDYLRHALLYSTYRLFETQ